MINKSFFNSASMLNLHIEEQNYSKVVFTNGVFDVLHAGHIDILQFARSKGDCLVLGLNSDLSVKRLKGENRPVFSLEERAEVLLAIDFVDYVIPFEEDTPKQILELLTEVDIMVKGGDYRGVELPESKVVTDRGGEFVLFDFKSDISSSKILNKIKERKC